MTLDELLWNINENTVIQLFNQDGCVLDVYDGHNSIDEKYNPCEVTDIFVDENKLCIEIETEVA